MEFYDIEKSKPKSSKDYVSFSSRRGDGGVDFDTFIRENAKPEGKTPFWLKKIIWWVKGWFK